MTDHLNQYAYAGGDIYREALPQLRDRIDLTALDERGIDFAYEWLEQLLHRQSFELVAKAHYAVNQQLKHLYFEARNFERVRGSRILGFGYPLLILSLKEELLAAPLFVWELQMEPSPNVTESWLFSHQALHRIHVNRYLLDLLREHYGYDGRPTLDAAVYDNLLTGAEIVECANEVAAGLQLEHSFSNPNITASPDLQEVEDMARGGAIHWSGVLGLFPPQPTGRTGVGLPADEEVEGGGHGFGLPELDPFQAGALQSALHRRYTVVEGPAGSGKTRLLLHLLINALSNGRKTLLISGSLGGLREIQSRLAALSINPFNFILRDETHDKGLLLELLKAAAEGGGMPINFDRDHYRILLDKARRLWARLNDNYRSVRRPVFGPYTWTETVGLFLRSSRREGKELLSSQLHPQDFELSYEEFGALKEDIARSHPLYREVRTLRHPLTRLHGRIFTEMEKAEGLAYTEQQIEHFLAKATRLQHRYISKTNGYADKLTAYYEHHFRELNRRLEELKEQLAEGANRYGDRFEESGTGGLRLAGVFSEKARETLAAREQVGRQYRGLQERFALSPFFDFRFAPAADGKNMSRIRASLAAFEKELHDWRNQIPATVQEEVQRLSDKSVNPRLSYEEHIAGLESRLDLLIRELNDAELFGEPFENKMLTIPKRQKYLEEIIEHLETTRLYLRDYDAFYDWQHNWLLLTEVARKLVHALIKVKPGDWEAAFESWYLNNVLTGTYVPELPAGDRAVGEFFEVRQRLDPLLPSQILSYWQERRSGGFEALRRRDRETYQLLFNRREQEQALSTPLSELFRRALPAITEALPVLMMTPAMAGELLADAPEGTFDYLLFDEAEDLPFAQAAALLPTARQLVICGDFRRLLPGRSLSLLEKVQREGWRLHRLEGNHRWSPGDLRRFMVKGEAALEKGTLHYEAVNGLYDEAAGTNDREAQRIIHLLNQIKKTPQRTFPLVGIVAFTEAQRDLIADYLLQIKRRNAPGADLVRQLERNGMGVYHLDELTGQQFQVLIAAGTYGPVDTKGRLTLELEALNRPQGIPQLNMLMSCALDEVFVLSSIREEDLQDLADEPARGGTFLLANYLLYIRAVDRADTPARDRIARTMREWMPAGDLAPRENPFLPEVARSLQPYLQPGQIVEGETSAAGHALPLVVRGSAPEKPAFALYDDGFLATTPFTDFVWEYRQVIRLREAGYEHLPVWSADWWRDARQEARRLASRLIKVESREEEE